MVDDEIDYLTLLKLKLVNEGFEVIATDNGKDALALIAQEKPDLVVSDVVMPEMDGPTMLTELRKAKPDLKVIFVSGYPDDRFKTGLDPDAHFAFLPKPFTLKQLVAAVKQTTPG